MTDARAPHVLVAGGGIAGLEALLALRDLAGDRVSLTLVAPTDTFAYRPESVVEPFGLGRPERVALDDVARDAGARFERARLASVDAGRRRVTMTTGEHVGYDELIVAVGAEPYAAVPGAITWDADGAHDAFRRLLAEIDSGTVSHVAVVVPPAAAWPLPAYELALLLAHRARSMGRRLTVTLVTAEPEPLALFGAGPSAAVAAELREAAVTLHASSFRAPPSADRVVAVPSATGPAIAGLPADDRGFIAVDEQCRTNVAHIHAIGDVVGQPMLAHKAMHEAKVAAEVIAGHDVVFDPRGIPSIAYTDPEVAWTGLTETEAKAQGIEYEKATFPWAASGRALGLGRPEGVTKLLIDPETRQVLGAGMVGPQAGDLVSEAALALELGADAEDIGLTIHPHPTLSETVAFAAEVLEGTITDLYVPKRKAPRG